MKLLALFVTLIGSLYQDLALADPKVGEAKAFFCDLCHNTGVHDGTAPLLQAQPAAYIVIQLQAFKDQRRTGGAMTTNVSSMSSEDMRDLADYFAAQAPLRTPFRPDPLRVALGRENALGLGCAGCHRADYSGGGDVPRLAGQWWDYLSAQLKNFRSGGRVHGQAAAADTTQNPDAADSENLAHFLTSLN
jgi:cytochrome c553